MLNFSDMKTLTRLLYLDIDTVDQALSDTNLGLVINYWYHWWFVNYSPQLLTDTAVLLFAATNTSKTFTTGDNPVLSIAQVTATSGGTNILDRVEVGEIRRRQTQHIAGSATSTKETGLPTMYAVQPDEPSTGNDGTPYTFTIFVYPVPDATTTVTIVQRAAPDDLSSTLTPRCTPFDARLICRAAAVDASALTGDFDLSNALLRSLPQEMQAALAVRTEFLKPNPQQLGKVNA